MLFTIPLLCLEHRTLPPLSLRTGGLTGVFYGRNASLWRIYAADVTFVIVYVRRILALVLDLTEVGAT